MPYFWPSRGLQVRGLIKNLSGTYRTEYTFNQVRALEYEATSFEHAGPMRQDTERSSDKHHGSKRKMATSMCDDNPRVQ